MMINVALATVCEKQKILKVCPNPVISSLSVNESKLVNGIYYIKVILSDNSSIKKSFIKQ